MTAPNGSNLLLPRLERHQTPSAKKDGMSIKPAVNPGKPRLPGFLLSGALQQRTAEAREFGDTGSTPLTQPQPT
jgi:hypothetical protein